MQTYVDQYKSSMTLSLSSGDAIGPLAWSYISTVNFCNMSPVISKSLQHFPDTIRVVRTLKIASNIPEPYAYCTRSDVLKAWDWLFAENNISLRNTNPNYITRFLDCQIQNFLIPKCQSVVFHCQTHVLLPKKVKFGSEKRQLATLL